MEFDYFSGACNTFDLEGQNKVLLCFSGPGSATKPENGRQKNKYFEKRRRSLRQKVFQRTRRGLKAVKRKFSGIIFYIILFTEKLLRRLRRCSPSIIYYKKIGMTVKNSKILNPIPNMGMVVVHWPGMTENLLQQGAAVLKTKKWKYSKMAFGHNFKTILGTFL